MEVVAHAEGRADILQVVLDDRLAILRDERVDRVRGLEVGEVRPRAEDAERSQLAPMLVRHEIVGIVWTGARVLERVENLAGQLPAGNDTIASVRFTAQPVSRIAFMSSCVNGVRLPFGRRTVAFGSIVVFLGSNVVRNDSTWL